MAQARRGKVVTAETRAKIAASRQGRTFGPQRPRSPLTWKAMHLAWQGQGRWGAQIAGTSSADCRWGPVGACSSGPAAAGLVAVGLELVCSMAGGGVYGIVEGTVWFFIRDVLIYGKFDSTKYTITSH